MLKRAGGGQPSLLTTRWAMSYLRGPLMRQEISRLAEAGLVTSGPTTQLRAVLPTQRPRPRRCRPSPTTRPPVEPTVATGITRSFLAPPRPGPRRSGAGTGTRLQAAAIARVRLRYDETKADLVHDEEYEAVLSPLTAQPRMDDIVAVDYDDRDLLPEAPAGAVYRLPPAEVGIEDVVERAEVVPGRSPGANAHHPDPRQPGSQAVLAGGRDARGVRRALLAGGRRPGRRRHRGAREEVRHQAPDPARARRPRSRHRRAGRGPARGRARRHGAGGDHPRRGLRRRAEPALDPDRGQAHGVVGRAGRRGPGQGVRGAARDPRPGGRASRGDRRPRRRVAVASGEHRAAWTSGWSERTCRSSTCGWCGSRSTRRTGRARAQARCPGRSTSARTRATTHTTRIAHRAIRWVLSTREPPPRQLAGRGAGHQRQDPDEAGDEGRHVHPEQRAG